MKTKKTPTKEASDVAQKKLAAVRKNGYRFAEKSKVLTLKERVKKEEKALREYEVGERRRHFVSHLAPDLVKAIGKMKDAEAWKIAQLLVESEGFNSFEAPLSTVGTPRGMVLGYMFTHNFPLNYNNTWDENAVEAWKLAGIEVVALSDQSEKEAQQVLPWAANKKKGGKR